MKVYLCVIGVIACMTAVSCAAPKQSLDAPLETKFDSGSRSAIVVYGTWSRPLDAKSRGRISSYALQWVKFSPRTRDILDGGFSVLREKCRDPEYVETLEKCNLDVPDWYVSTVTPGEYAIHYLFTRNFYRYDFVNFFSTKTLLDTRLLDKKLVQFSIEAGQILYIGDFIVDLHKKGRMGYERNDVQAKQALQQYKGIEGELTYSRPLGIGPEFEARKDGSGSCSGTTCLNRTAGLEIR